MDVIYTRLLNYDAAYDSLTCATGTGYNDHSGAIAIFWPMYTLVWITFGLIYYNYNMKTYAHFSEGLQMFIVAIPVGKAVQSFFVFLNLWTCSRTSESIVTLSKYLLMVIIAAETVNRTIISAILFIAASGYGTMRFFFDGFDASQAAKCLGAAYLVHSAYFITDEAESLHVVLRYLMLLFYFCLMFYVVKYATINLGCLKSNIRFAERHNLSNVFGVAFKLK